MTMDARGGQPAACLEHGNERTNDCDHRLVSLRLSPLTDDGNRVPGFGE